MKLDLLTNATMVDGAIRFVSSHKSKEKLKSSDHDDSKHDKEESNEPDYNEDKDQLEEEQQEEEAGEIITTSSINYESDFLNQLAFIFTI
jgi:hypothetical protein